MSPLTLTLCYCVILILHFIGDWVLQSDEVAKKKSSDNYTLFFHVCLYTFPFMVMLGVLGALFYHARSLDDKLGFVIVTFLSHLCTDYFTSRYNKAKATAGDVHGMYVGIGFDQMIHGITLFLTFYYFFVAGRGEGFYAKAFFWQYS